MDVQPANSTETPRAVKPRRREPARAQAPARARGAGRPRHVERERFDLDQRYLAEMASSSVLSSAEELAIAQRIVEAERAILQAIVHAPAGSRALAALRDDLETSRVEIRDVLLNPDEQGIDLATVRDRVVHALRGETRDAVEALAAVRLDAGLVEGLVAAVRSSTEEADVEAAKAIDRARRALKRSKEALVVGNLRLVVLFARKYLGRGVPLLDLVQEGNLGLMRAVDKFDHRRGFRFSTYAAWWIKQALQRGLLDRSLRFPVHVADDRRRVGKMRAAFLAQHRREPRAHEIATATGLTRERIENILALPAQPSSLDAPMGEDGDASLIDFVASSAALPEDAVALRTLGHQLGALMEGLAPREQQVLHMRFGIGQREHTLEEVGRALQLTRERIRQIERSALEKLRARSDRFELRSYLGD
jgi:RNA polymerase primary sigma factor